MFKPQTTRRLEHGSRAAYILSTIRSGTHTESLGSHVVWRPKNDAGSQDSDKSIHSYVFQGSEAREYLDDVDKKLHGLLEFVDVDDVHQFQFIVHLDEVVRRRAAANPISELRK